MIRKTLIGILTGIALMTATIPIVSAGSFSGLDTGALQEEIRASLDSMWNSFNEYSGTTVQTNGMGCSGAYEIWAVDENDGTVPIVIAQDKKVLVGTGLFENIEGGYALPDGAGIDYGPMVDFTLDVIKHLSDNPNPRVALYDPDPLADGNAGWAEIQSRMIEWPSLDDWSINPFETASYEMVLNEWVSSGDIQYGAQIEDVGDLYSIAGDLAYEVLIIDQGGQANTPDYDSLSNAIQVYLDMGGSVIISAYAFIDWASFFESGMKPGVEIWYEADMNDQFLQDMFPDVNIIKEREREFGMGSWEWRIKDYAANADVTQAAPSSVQTLYSRDDGLHGFLRLEVPPGYDVEVDFDPDTLNKDSNGRWVTVYLETPMGCDPRDIDPSTILLNGILSPVLDPHYGWVHSEDSYIMDHDEDGLWERMVKFIREDVAAILPTGDTVWINITGETYDGIEFSGSDVIRVIELNIGMIAGTVYLSDRTGAWIVMERYL